MDDTRKTKQELIEELKQLRQRVAQLEQAYRFDQARELSDTELGRLYHLAVVEAPVSVWACDRNWEIKFWNSGAEKIYNTRKEDVIGKSFLELFVSDKDREQAIADIKRVFNGEIIQGYVAEDVLPDGTTKTIYTTVYPLFDENGSVYLQAEIGLDITEQAKAAKTLKAAREVSRILIKESRLTEVEVLELIYEQASKVMDTRNMYIALYDEEKDEVSFGLVSDNGRRVDVDNEPGWQPRKAGQGLTEWVIRNRQPLRPPNPAEAYRTIAKHYVGEVPKSWMGVPLIIQDKVIGVIVLISDEQKNCYTQHHQDLLQDYATITIQSARLYQQLSRRINELEMIKELGDNLRSLLTFPMPSNGAFSTE
jgi:PAS domain S-box-containing protein